MRFCFTFIPFVCLVCSVIGKDSISHSAFFLNDTYYRRVDWLIGVSSTLNKIYANADYHSSMIPGLNALSYSGSVSKGYSESLPLQEQHNLMARIQGVRLLFGIRASLDLSVCNNRTAEETWKFRPGGEQSEFYIKSVSKHTNHSQVGYGVTGNCRTGNNGKFATVMVSGNLIQNYGYLVEEDKINNEDLRIKVYDYQPEDISYVIKAGMLFTNEFILVRRRHLSFAAMSVQYDHFRNPLRASLESFGINSDAEDTDFLFSGYTHNKRVLDVIIGFKPNDLMTYSKSRLWGWKNVSSHLNVNSVKVGFQSIYERKTVYSHIIDVKTEIGATDTVVKKKQVVDMSAMIVPEIIILRPISIRLPVVVQSEGGWYLRTHTGWVSAVFNVRFPLVRDIIIDVQLSSGDLAIDLNKGPFDETPLLYYRAHTASLKLSFAGLF